MALIVVCLLQDFKNRAIFAIMKTITMTLQEIARTSSNLVKDRTFMLNARNHYNMLFNRSNPIVGQYTPYQQFLQERAQYFAVQVFRIEAAMERFINIADSLV